MRSALDLASWPVTVRIPVLLATLMVAVSVLVSQQVLTRLQATQDRHVQELGNAYLDGLSSSLIPAVLRHDVWETFDTVDRAKGLYNGLTPVGTVVLDAAGLVLAASDPRSIATGSRLPADVSGSFPSEGGFRTEDAGAKAFLSRSLDYQDRRIGTVLATFDTSHLLAERRSVLLTLLATNACITILLVILGYVVVGRMIRPMRILTEHLQRSSRTDVLPVPDELTSAGGETGRLFRSYARLVEAVREREDLARRLAEEERLASLGRLASGMAHEINNPLGGLMNTLDTLKKHGEKPLVRRSSIDLLDRGLAGIRDVVRTALVAYRSGGETRPLQPDDLNDLRLLMRPETERRGITLGWTSDVPVDVAVDATKVRQTLLNVLLNACAASPAGSVVAFTARLTDRSLIVTVDDSGPGMPEEASRFLTSAADRPSPYEPNARLGLWLVRRLVDELGATLAVGRSSLGGARISLEFPFRKETLADVA